MEFGGGSAFGSGVWLRVKVWVGSGTG